MYNIMFKNWFKNKFLFSIMQIFPPHSKPVGINHHWDGSYLVPNIL